MRRPEAASLLHYAVMTGRALYEVAPAYFGPGLTSLEMEMWIAFQALERERERDEGDR